MSTPTLPPVALFVGDAAVRVRQAEEKLTTAALGGSASAFNHAVFSANDCGLAPVDLARTQPMMSRQRVVVVRELESASAELVEALIEYVAAPNPSTVLILCGAKLPPAVNKKNRGKVLDNAVKKVGHSQRYRTSDENPERFAVDAAAELGAELDFGAARLLVELVGSDLGRLQAEVDKAVAYASEDGATPVRVLGSHVEAVSSLVAEAVVWDLTDAIVRRDVDGCLAVAHRLLEEGEATHRLLAMVTWQIRQLLVLQDCDRRGVDTRSVGLRMPGRKISAARAVLRRRPLDEARVLDRLRRANRDLNRSRAGDRRVFEALMLDLAGA